jgi:hypothetical protein
MIISPGIQGNWTKFFSTRKEKLKEVTVEIPQNSVYHKPWEWGEIWSKYPFHMFRNLYARTLTPWVSASLRNRRICILNTHTCVYIDTKTRVTCVNNSCKTTYHRAWYMVRCNKYYFNLFSLLSHSFFFPFFPQPKHSTFPRIWPKFDFLSKISRLKCLLLDALIFHSTHIAMVKYQGC